jgi:hypothetical protein
MNVLLSSKAGTATTLQTRSPATKAIEPGGSGCSGFTEGAEESIDCSFEGGGLGANHFLTAVLGLARFDFGWLTDGKDSSEAKRQ